MAITRRQFLQRSGLVAAGTVLGPGLFGNPFVRRALADAIGDRYLIVLFLDGGNDGLNTVVPVTNGSGTLRSDYHTARGTGMKGSYLELTPTDLAGSHIGNDPHTGAQLALHPGLNDVATRGFKALWDANKLAVIQGCGYPNYSLSHDDSRNIWRTGNPWGFSDLASTGWAGRYLISTPPSNSNPPPFDVPPPPYTGTDIPGLTVDDEVAPEYRQFGTSVLAVPSLADFEFPHDDRYPSDDGAKDTVFNTLSASAGMSAQDTIRYIGNTGANTLAATVNYHALDGDYVGMRPSSIVDGYDLLGGLAQDFREVAKVIYGVERGATGVSARFFQVRTGGFDTHSQQGTAQGGHYELLARVGNAIKYFYDDCAAMTTELGKSANPIQNRVCILVWSEFSRNIPQNDNGTDHGSQGPMFVIGGSVNGGVYGNHPNIRPSALENDGRTAYSQDNTNSFRSTDFRDVYGTILKHWLGLDQTTILSSVLRVDPAPGNPAYWTQPNFDLGFL
jgi:uncharacterized protein (DUF1501 family)